MHQSLSALLAGPRGRHLCLAVAHQLDQAVGGAWFHASRHPGDGGGRAALRSALEQVDPAPVEHWDGPFAFADAMDDTVSAAMGWQEPRDEDRVAADPALTAALAPIAAAISRAPAAQWWSTGIDLGAQRYTARYDEHFPAAEPRLDGLAARLATWRTDEEADNTRARTERPDDPTANWSGTWWSTPTPAGVPTTRALPGLGSANLLWEEDSFGQWDAFVHPVRPRTPPRIAEIDGPQAWADLVTRFPLDVTWSRRHDWYRVTGTDDRWLIPDWEAVSRDYDAVHLSVLGYLATATRRIPLDGTTATLLCGWDPDQTWWLTDTLHASGPREHWHTTSGEAPEGWHLSTP
ncbi:hypothetical protein [Amnibacterium sp.]|uniref:hypothetical protein n=1 Tax=Amnibacterium sp. TaxID=1872496 RepID=UPI003F7CD156